MAGRPAEAGTRAGPGRWEGDLGIGDDNQSAAAALIGRSSRHTLLAALPGGCAARSVARAVTAAPALRPGLMLKTLIWGQGTEMARWADIEAVLDTEVCFCDPHSPRQCPANEHTITHSV